MQRRVRASDYSWFDVSFDDDGNATTIVESKIVWLADSQHVGMLSARLHHIIELAKNMTEE